MLSLDVTESIVSMPPPGRVVTAARDLHWQSRALGNEVTWERVRGKLPETDGASASAAAVAASATDPEERSVPKRRPKEYCDSQVALEMISSRNALSGTGTVGPRFHTYSQSSGPVDRLPTRAG